jgi:hypothetical protein
MKVIISFEDTEKGVAIQVCRMPSECQPVQSQASLLAADVLTLLEREAEAVRSKLGGASCCH